MGTVAQRGGFPGSMGNISGSDDALKRSLFGCVTACNAWWPGVSKHFLSKTVIQIYTFLSVKQFIVVFSNVWEILYFCGVIMLFCKLLQGEYIFIHTYC